MSLRAIVAKQSPTRRGDCFGRRARTPSQRHLIVSTFCILLDAELNLCQTFPSLWLRNQTNCPNIFWQSTRLRRRWCGCSGVRRTLLNEILSQFELVYLRSESSLLGATHPRVTSSTADTSPDAAVNPSQTFPASWFRNQNNIGDYKLPLTGDFYPAIFR